MDGMPLFPRNVMTTSKRKQQVLVSGKDAPNKMLRISTNYKEDSIEDSVGYDSEGGEEPVANDSKVEGGGAEDDRVDTNTKADFERLLAEDPNSSEVWIKFMAFYVSLGCVSRARSIANQAIAAIESGYEKERLNVWCALLFLESRFGQGEIFNETLERACQHNKPEDIRRRMRYVSTRTTNSNDMCSATEPCTKNSSTGIGDRKSGDVIPVLGCDAHAGAISGMLGSADHAATIPGAVEKNNSALINGTPASLVAGSNFKSVATGLTVNAATSERSLGVMPNQQATQAQSPNNTSQGQWPTLSDIGRSIYYDILYFLLGIPSSERIE